MKYDKIVEAIFIERPNRFIARVKIDGAEELYMIHLRQALCGMCPQSGHTAQGPLPCG